MLEIKVDLQQLNKRTFQKREIMPTKSIFTGIWESKDNSVL